jgi:hypothetical protein
MQQFSVDLFHHESDPLLPRLDRTQIEYESLPTLSISRRPAITAAVHHATGVRVRELPVKIENLLG